MDKAFELLSEYTGEQWGMVTARQAKCLGVDAVTLHRLKEAGFLDLVRRGVYAATSAAVDEQYAEQAAWLALRPDVPAWNRDPLDADDGTLSHATAARLHGLGELVNDRIAFTVPRRRTSRDVDLWFKIDDSLTTDDVTLVDGLPVTTVLRTVCDLLDQHIDASHVATIIREAVESGQLRLDTLADHIAPYARRYRVRPLTGAALLEHLLEQIGLTIADLATRPTPGRRVDAAVLTAAQYRDHQWAAGQLVESVQLAQKAWNEQTMQLAIAALLPAAEEVRKNMHEMTAPIAQGVSSNLAEVMLRSPAMEELRKNLRAISAPATEGLAKSLAEMALRGSAGEELRQQIARAAATGHPLTALARDDESRDKPDSDDD